MIFPRTVIVATIATVALAVAPVVDLPGPIFKPVAATLAFSPLASAPVVASTSPSTETREIKPKDKFNTVGVVWKDGQSGGTVEMRVQNENGTWGEWLEISPIDDGPDPGTEEAKYAREGTDPIYVPKSKKVQIRVQKDRTEVLDKAEVVTVDPGTSAADGKVEPNKLNSAGAASPKPSIITRAQWGANESYRNCAPVMNKSVEAVTLHHTAGPNDYTRSTAAKRVRSDYAYHTNALGWCDLGYNAVIDKYGNIYEGRAGGFDKAVQGAHSSGFNKDTWAISLLGNNSKLTPSWSQQKSLVELMAWKLSSYNHDPKSYTKLTSAGKGGTNTKYDKGTVITRPRIFGHRDVGSTSCPGAAAYKLLPAIRDKVAARAKVSATPTVTSRSLILKEHKRLGGDSGYFGPMVKDETKVTGGSYIKFRNGEIFRINDKYFRKTYGGIGARYWAYKGPHGGLGLPKTDEYWVKDTKGRAQQFTGANGAVYWSSGTGAQAVFGGIHWHWTKQGGPTGRLGFPTTEESDIPDYVGAGRVQSFQGGQIYWGPRVGATDVSGGALQAYKDIGGAKVIGMPMAMPVPVGSGTKQHFELANAWIYGQKSTGYHVVKSKVRTQYEKLGGPTGKLGFPTGPERAARGGRVQYFEKGRLFWSDYSGNVFEL